jgi:hypothetical protein
MVGPVDQIVLLDAPVEAAAMLDGKSSATPKVLFAVSIGLSSLQGAHDYLQSKGALLTPGAAGSFRVEIEDVHCLLAWAMGAAPVRLVCSDRARALDELGPYMTRGMPEEALGSGEIFTELRAEPWRRRFGRQVQMVKLGVPFLLRELELDNPAFDAVMSDTLYALAEEAVSLVDDLDALRFVGKLDNRAETLNLSWSVKLRGQRSWFGQLLREASAQMAGPPEVFWSLPADAYDASYAVQVRGPQQKALTAGLLKLIGGGLDYLGIPAKLRDDTVRAFQVTFDESNDGAGANGGVGLLGAGTSLPMEYHLSANSEKMHLDQLLRQLFLVYNHPATRKTIQGKFGAEKWVEVVSRRPIAGSGIPANATVYEVTVPAELRKAFDKSGKLKDTPKVTYITTVNAAGRSWLAFGTDEKLLGKQLAAVLAPSAGSATLAQNRKLDSLRQERALMAGFLTLRSVMAPLAELMPTAAPSTSRLEHGGSTPVLNKLTIEQGGSELVLSAAVPRLAMGDLVNLVMTLAAHADELVTQ